MGLIYGLVSSLYYFCDPCAYGKSLTTSSTTSGIEVDGIDYSSKHDTSGFKDKASGARVAVHLDRRYNTVNVV